MKTKTSVNYLNLLKQRLIERQLFRKTYSWFSIHFGLRSTHKITELLSGIDNWIGKIAYRLYSKNVPVVSNKVLFLTFRGGFDCNPKAIVKEIVENNIPIEVVWVAKGEYFRKMDMFPNDIKVVKWGSEEFYKEAASSRIWVDNSVVSVSLGLVKKHNQLLIETWHGSIGLKKFDSNQNRKWVKKARLSGEKTDYIISNSIFETRLYKRTFWDKTTIVECGHPRNDILFLKQSKRDTLKKQVFDQLGIDLGYNVVLYAPTFRDNYGNFDVYNIDYVHLSEVLAHRFGGKWKIIVRFHARIRNYLIQQNENGKLPKYVCDATDYPDIADLLAVCDVGITDSSSWICDFVLTRRPAFLFILDYRSYYQERGFEIPLSKTPFSISESNQELFDNIERFDENTYCERCETFLQENGCKEEGTASKAAVSLIVNKLYPESFINQSDIVAHAVQRDISRNNYERAKKRLRDALITKSMDVRSDLIDLLWEDNTGASDLEIRMIVDSMRAGANYEYQYYTAKMLTYGKTYKQNTEQAVSILKTLERSERVTYLIADILFENEFMSSSISCHNELLHLAEQGKHQAMIRLGRQYWRGIDTHGDLNEALIWTKKANSCIDVLNYQLQLFDVLWVVNTKETRKEMIELIMPLALEGHIDAMKRLSKAYWVGRGKSKNLREAEKWMRLASEKGDKESTYLLCDIWEEMDAYYYNCMLLNYLFDAKNDGDPEVIARRGRLYLRGNIVKKDTKLAIGLYKRSIASNLDWASLELFDYYYKKREHTSELMQLLLPVALRGNGEAMGKLGTMYRAGIGVVKDLSKAIYWMRKAVSKNVGWAKNRLFDIMWDASDSRYYKEMFEIASQFSKQGNGNATLRLARLYIYGKGVEVNYELAISLFEEAEKKGIKLKQEDKDAISRGRGL